MPETTTTQPATAATPPPSTISPTASPVVQPVASLAQSITDLLGELTFDGAGSGPGSAQPNSTHDPEVSMAEAQWGKLDAKFKAQQNGLGAETTSPETPAAAGVDSTKPSGEPTQPLPAVEGEAAAEGQSAVSTDPTAPAVEAAATGLDPDDLDDPSLPTVIDITKPRGQRIYAAYKAMTSLAAPPDQGGIGHVPAPEQVRDYFISHNEMQRLLGDFTDPSPDQFITGLSRTDPGALARLAIALPQFVQHTDPTAYEHLATPVISNAIEALVEHARVAQDQAAKDYWFGIANGLKFYLSDGKAQLDKTVLDKPADPLAGERTELERLRSENARRQQQDYSLAAQQFTQALGHDTHTAILSTIEQTLVNVKPRLDAKVYQDLVKSIYSEAQASVVTNPFAQTSINNARRQSLAAGAVMNRDHWGAHVKKITGTYMQFAKPVIAQAARTRLSAYTKGAVAQSQSQQSTAAAKPIPRPAIAPGAPAGASQRAGQSQTSNFRPPNSNQPGTKTGSGDQRYSQTNAESTLEFIHQLVQ